MAYVYPAHRIVLAELATAQETHLINSLLALSRPASGKTLPSEGALLDMHALGLY